MKSYQSGDIFGELAVLYSTPRQAMIVSRVKGKLYRLNRYSYATITRENAVSKFKFLNEILSKVEILQDISQSERDKVAEVLKEQKFEEGEYVFKEGE